MINMPKDYENININYEPAAEGPHLCSLMKVEEMKSQSGLQMLLLYFDFDENDAQAGFYLRKYQADQKSPNREAKWRGVMYMVVDQGTNYGPANLKRLVTAVEDSNPGFRVQWGENFCSCLAGKKVGIVFRIEEYIQTDGQLGASAKPFRLCDYNNAMEQPIPKRKCLPENEKPQKAPEPPFEQMSFSKALSTTPAQVPANPQATQEGFMNVAHESLDDEGLPFH